MPLLGKDHFPQGYAAAFGSTETNGFVLLAGVLKHLTPEFSRDFHELPVKQVFPSEEDLTIRSHLGSGAFSNVVKLNQREFMKMPKSAKLRLKLFSTIP